jgi:hypothetical protein
MSTCVRCSGFIAGDDFVCGHCRQIEAIEKQTKQLLAQAERNARLASEQAERNARLASEQSMSKKDAYRMGFNFIESSTGNELVFFLSLDGKLEIYVPNPFLTDTLGKAFDEGLKNSFSQLAEQPPTDYMTQCAFNGGYGLMPHFHIPYKFDLCGVTREAKTHALATNYQRTVDAKTGEVIYSYDLNFSDHGAIVQAYQDGLNTRHRELDENSPEQMLQRVQKMLERKEQVINNQIKSKKEAQKYWVALFVSFAATFVLFKFGFWFFGLLMIAVTVFFGFAIIGCSNSADEPDGDAAEKNGATKNDSNWIPQWMKDLGNK